jgi:hypothetical protein
VPNVAQMQTRAARSDRPAVDLRRLVAGFLRMAPDVAIVGEVAIGKDSPNFFLTLKSTLTWAMLGAPGPDFPVERCGTFGGATKCDRLSTLNRSAGPRNGRSGRLATVASRRGRGVAGDDLGHVPRVVCRLLPPIRDR